MGPLYRIPLSMFHLKMKTHTVLKKLWCEKLKAMSKLLFQLIAIFYCHNCLRLNQETCLSCELYLFPAITLL